MADRSTLKKNLRYHRIVVIVIVAVSIWGTYEFSSNNRTYKSGVPKVIGEHINGKDEGEWIWFYENGKKQMQGNFVNGKRDGVWIIWDGNGNKINENTYENDKLNGKSVHWYTSGKIESESIYANDKLISITYYNEDGTIK